MTVATLQTAVRQRAYVAVTGPDAAGYLERMVSNGVESLPVGDACEALLLSAKARVVAPLVVVRRGQDDFLLLTEPELGVRVVRELVRARFAAKCEIAQEDHRSALVLGLARESAPVDAGITVANHDYGVDAVELLDTGPPPDAVPIADGELERLRILARTPRYGRELDDRVMPAEAGLEERAISFTKGCYPGQEPVARLHYRGHPNRTLRVLTLDGATLPAYDAELTLDGKVVGRVTSAAPDAPHGVVCLAYVRREVPDDADLRVGDRPARHQRS
jgi:folate-binding protein YgfZ